MNMFEPLNSIRWLISALMTKGKDLIYIEKSELVRNQAQMISYLGSCCSLVRSYHQSAQIPQWSSWDAETTMPAPCLKLSQPTVACGLLSTFLSLAYRALHGLAPAHLSSLTLHCSPSGTFFSSHTYHTLLLCTVIHVLSSAWNVLPQWPHTDMCLTSSPSRVRYTTNVPSWNLWHMLSACVHDVRGISLPSLFYLSHCIIIAYLSL